MNKDCFPNAETPTVSLDYAKQMLPAGWISKNKCLPEFGQGVLIALSNGFITIGYRKKKPRSYDWQLFGDRDVSLAVGEDDYVTHWMPLPEVPACR